MRVKTIDIPTAGASARACQLISLNDDEGLMLNYCIDEDNGYWRLQCRLIVAYEVVGNEYAMKDYLLKLPDKGIFFEILDSPWISKFGDYKAEILAQCKHYVFRFYNETIEIIAQNFYFEKLNEKPSIIF